MLETRLENVRLFQTLLRQLDKDISQRKKKTALLKDSILSLKGIERFQVTNAMVANNLSHIEDHALLLLG